MSINLEVFFGGDVASATAVPSAKIVVERGVKGDPAQPLGGSIRTAAGKAEAGGPWTVVADDETLDLSVSNRFIVILNDLLLFSRTVPANAPAGTTLAIKVVNNGGAFDWTGVIWPDPGTPPTIVDNASKITSLAFEKFSPNGQWLGFVGPVHAWNGV
jgi:hypothetical protein